MRQLISPRASVHLSIKWVNGPYPIELAEDQEMFVAAPGWKWAVILITIGIAQCLKKTRTSVWQEQNEHVCHGSREEQFDLRS